MTARLSADIGHDTDAAILAASARSEEFRQPLERVATLVEQLVAERTHIREAEALAPLAPRTNPVVAS